MTHASEFIQIQKLEGSFCRYCLFLFKWSIAQWVAVYEKCVEPLPVYFRDRMRQDFPPLSYKKQMRMPRSSVNFPTAASLLLGKKCKQAALSTAKCFQRGFLGVICASGLPLKRLKWNPAVSKGQFSLATVPSPKVVSSRSKQKWSYTWNFVNTSFTSSTC